MRMSTLILLCVALTGCKDKPDDEHAPLVGKWKAADLELVMSFHPDGTYAYDFGPNQGHGAFALRKEGAGLALATCIEGDACRSGGLWTRQDVTLVGDRLTYVAGGQVWKRVSPKP